mgnify:CR=1 FL=1
MPTVPKPISFTKDEGFFELSKNTVFSGVAKGMGGLFSYLGLASGVENRLTAVIDDGKQDEEYMLQVSPGEIKIIGGERGIYYGVMTLLQLAAKNLKDGIANIPVCKIDDRPKYAYRGFMLDVSRHFFPPSTIKKILDVLSVLKINYFHLHISDNQGYRLESKEFPKLNEIGSVRAGTRGDGKEVKGYYTAAEIEEMVGYALERRIEIIPELDIPGHTIALLASYPYLGCEGKEMKVAETFGISDNILCAGKESTYEFLYKLVDEIASYFPSKYFHLGGDEAPKTKWKNCPHCKKALIDNNLKSFSELQSHFINKIIERLEQKGKTVIVWNEAIYGGLLKDGAICQYWSDGKKPRRVFAAADGGRKTIISKFSPYYLDYPYGMTPLKKTYNFDPEMDGFTSEGLKNIMGVEAPLWTEYVDTEEKLFYQMLPRLMAVAESGWGSAKDYTDFKVRLESLRPLFAMMGIKMPSLGECDPGPIKGAIATAKFFINAFDRSMINSSINAIKAQSERRR